MITILHVIQDNKFNAILKRFESDDRLANKKVLILPKKDYKFIFLKNTEDIKLLYYKKDIKRFFSEEKYDAVWFHSLDDIYYRLIKYIPSGKKIVWWTWGWDIYDSFYGLKPLLEIDLYKPQTAKLIDNRITAKKWIKELIKKYLFKFYYKGLQNEVLGRIDYFVPVIPIEYKLMSQNPNFHAEEFYFPEVKNRAPLPDPVEKDNNGIILLGNSATYSMNHVDIIESLKHIGLKNRKMVVPLNYGDAGCSDVVKKALVSYDGEAITLDQFMPKEEYLELINSCSYAIFGMMRQQAMANVYYCLKRGIKVFLYKDSIPYQYLKDIGAVVFAIEEITLEFLQKPVSVQDTVHNRFVIEQMEERRLLLYENGIVEIEREINIDGNNATTKIGF